MTERTKDYKTILPNFTIKRVNLSFKEDKIIFNNLPKTSRGLPYLNFSIYHCKKNEDNNFDCQFINCIAYGDITKKILEFNHKDKVSITGVLTALEEQVALIDKVTNQTMKKKDGSYFMEYIYKKLQIVVWDIDAFRENSYKDENDLNLDEDVPF